MDAAKGTVGTAAARISCEMLHRHRKTSEEVYAWEAALCSSSKLEISHIDFVSKDAQVISSCSSPTQKEKDDAALLIKKLRNGLCAQESNNL